MRDEALYLFQEHDERNRTVQVRGAEVCEEGYRDEQMILELFDVAHSTRVSFVSLAQADASCRPF